MNEDPNKTIMEAVDIEAFLDNHVRPYRSWYERTTARADRALRWARWTAIISGFVATAAAAFPASIFGTAAPIVGDLLKWLVVVLSATATLCSGGLQPYYYQIARRREAGRVHVCMIEQISAQTLYRVPQSVIERVEYLTSTIRDLARTEAEFGAFIGPDGSVPTINRPSKAGA